MLDQLVDNYIYYMKAMPTLMTNWIATYGKDAVLLQQSRETTEKYSNVFGRDMVGFDALSSKYSRVDIKILVDHGDWSKIVTKGAPLNIELAFEYQEGLVKEGDSIQFSQRGIIITYRITEIQVYQELLFKVDCNLATADKVGS